MRHSHAAEARQRRYMDVRGFLCQTQTLPEVHYKAKDLPAAVEAAAAWAEKFVREFAAYPEANLPWMKK